MLKVLFLLVMVHAAPEVFGQQAGQDSISWTVTSFADLKASSTVTNAGSEFRTYHNTIDWLQENGGQVYTYTIESTDGSWTDVTQDGEIVFHISWHALTGTLAFKRENGTLNIAMDIDKSGTNIISLLFDVNAVNEIQ